MNSWKFITFVSTFLLKKANDNVDSSFEEDFDLKIVQNDFITFPKPYLDSFKSTIILSTSQTSLKYWPPFISTYKIYIKEILHTPKVIAPKDLCLVYIIALVII